MKSRFEIGAVFSSFQYFLRMNPLVEQAIQKYHGNVKHPGKKIGQIEMLGLQLRLTVRLPRWYAKLLSRYPLAGAYLDYPVYEPDSDDDGYQSIRFARARDIYSESEKCYRGWLSGN